MLLSILFVGYELYFPRIVRKQSLLLLLLITNTFYSKRIKLFFTMQSIEYAKPAHHYCYAGCREDILVLNQYIHQKNKLEYIKYRKTFLTKHKFPFEKLHPVNYSTSHLVGRIAWKHPTVILNGNDTRKRETT